MKITVKNLILCAVAALGFSVAGHASAISILQFGGSTLLQPGTPGSAESLTNFQGTDGSAGVLSVVNGSTGIFAGIAVGTNFTANSPLVFDPNVVSVDPLFSFSDYEFFLDDSSVMVFQGGSGQSQFLNIFGRGTIFGPGGFEEMMSIAFSASGATDGGRISLQGNLATMNVPEGGASVLLLGMGLVGVETLRRRLQRHKA